MLEENVEGTVVLWEGEGGWLVYEYTGTYKFMFPESRAWVGHRCDSSHHVASNLQYVFNGLIDHTTMSNNTGFFSAEMPEPKGICGWCDTLIPSEVQGVVMLYNYGKEGEQHGVQ